MNSVDESQYKADFMISENYIKFSSELLRLSLLAIGGFGTLIFLRIKAEDKMNMLADPTFLILSLICFVISSGAALAHRYYATDTMSWYISLLRAEKKNDEAKMKEETKGLHRILKLSRISLIACEASFAAGVVVFFIAILNLLDYI